MKNSQNKLIIIIVIILVITSILAIYLSLTLSNNPPETDSSPSTNRPSNSTGSTNTTLYNSITKEIEELNDVNRFFTIQNIINNYYALIINKSNDELYKLLEDNYIKENNITRNNVVNKLNKQYEDVSFMAHDIYYNPDSKVTYYFINGYIINYIDLGSRNTYEKNVNLLLIVGSNRNYYIKPLKEDINIESYAKNYNITDVNINNDTNFSTINIDEKRLIQTYLGAFNNLIVADIDSAYNLLDSSMYGKYPTVDSFNNDKINVYNRLSKSVFSYNVKEENNQKIYYVQDGENNTITIIESKINNYKIKF